jgi:hypothetical protein
MHGGPSRFDTAAVSLLAVLPAPCLFLPSASDFAHEKVMALLATPPGARPGAATSQQLKASLAVGNFTVSELGGCLAQAGAGHPWDGPP